MLTVYQYPACGTCKKALKWLAARGVAFEAVDVVKTPPSAAELRAWKDAAGLPLRRLFNVSGQSYRDGGWKDRLGDVTEAEALEALSADGKLLKRPLAVRRPGGGGVPDVVLVGFDEAAWEAALGGEPQAQ